MSWSELKGLVHAASLDEYGQDVTYTPDGGSPATVQGVYRSAHEGVDFETGAPVSTNQPVLDVVEADLPATITVGKDEVQVAGDTWIVIDSQRDGEGMTRLFLTRKTT